jgi:hypothetical protein
LIGSQIAGMAEPRETEGIFVVFTIKSMLQQVVRACAESAADPEILQKRAVHPLCALLRSNRLASDTIHVLRFPRQSIAQKCIVICASLCGR